MSIHSIMADSRSEEDFVPPPRTTAARAGRGAAKATAYVDLDLSDEDDE